MPLQWSTLGEHDLAGDSLAETEEDSAYWAAVEKLPLDEPLPADLMQRFYSTTDPRPALRAAKYADCLDRFLRAFPKENMMFVDFADFVAQPEATVRSVLKFVGADAALPAYAFKPMPPGMQVRRWELWSSRRRGAVATLCLEVGCPLGRITLPPPRSGLAQAGPCMVRQAPTLLHPCAAPAPESVRRPLLMP